MLIHNAEVTGSLNINNVPFNSGSFSGSFRGDGSQLTGITGASTASYVEYSNVGNKPALVSGSSQITYSGLSGIPSGIVSGSSQVSFNGIVDKPTLVSGSSQVTYSGLTGIPAGIVSSSAQIVGYNVFATTGSNQFNGSQAITGSLTVTGQVVAQTLNVQQVTSSIVFSSGSNIFGNSLSNTQQFTGSVSVTGSLAVNGAGTFASSVTAGGIISTSGTGLNASVRINNTTSSTGKDWHLYSLNNGNFGLYNNTDGSYAYQVTPAGNLGLGVTPSAWSLGKAIEFGSIGNAVWGVSTTQFNVLQNAYYEASSYKYASSNAASYYQQASGIHTWYNAPSGTAGNAITFTPLMTLSAAGRLLIGKTNDEGFALDVVGTGRFANTLTITKSISYGEFGPNGSNLNLINTSTSETTAGNIQFIGFSGNATSPYQWGLISGEKDTTTADGNYAGSLTFWSTSGGANGEANSATYKRMTIKGDGKVGINTTIPRGVLDVRVASDRGITVTGTVSSETVISGMQGDVSANLRNLRIAGGNLIFNVGDGTNSTGTQAMAITSDGYLRMASGTGGIQFNGDTAAANALDDYEEGNWTPTFLGGTTNPTVSYAVRTGSYTKIGRQVTCNFEIGTTSNTGGDGNIRISGLPFTVGIRSYMAVATYNINNTATDPMSIFVEINASGTEMLLLQTADNATWANITWSQATNSVIYVNATITYFV
jgi:hypothetical protein